MRKCGLWSMVGDRKLCSDGMRRYIRRTLYLQSVSRCPLSGFREKGRTRSGRGNGEEASSGHFGHFGIFLPRARAMLPFLSFLLLLAARGNPITTPPPRRRRRPEKQLENSENLWERANGPWRGLLRSSDSEQGIFGSECGRVICCFACTALQLTLGKACKKYGS